jgi:hypothetical protein
MEPISANGKRQLLSVKPPLPNGAIGVDSAGLLCRRPMAG